MTSLFSLILMDFRDFYLELTYNNLFRLPEFYPRAPNDPHRILPYPPNFVHTYVQRVRAVHVRAFTYYRNTYSKIFFFSK
jgi:hypothetical protein